MKRIEFIAPVESMRGNLSETQKNIVYPTHDNRAYDGPVGERNTARNYQPIVIGAKRKDGKTYFSVKTKTTNHLTTNAKMAMAAMGAACSIFAAAIKNSAILAKMTAILKAYADHGYVYTYRQLFMPWIRDAVASKSAVIDLSSAGVTLMIDNPWQFRYEEALPNISIPQSILVKFWDVLSSGYSFYVNGETGICFDEDALLLVEDSWQKKQTLNVLDLTYNEEYDIMMKDGLFLYYALNGSKVFQSGSSPFVRNCNYKLSATAE